MLSRLILLTIAAILLLSQTDADTVANQCMAQQNFDSKDDGNLPTTAEEITMASFDAICGNYTDYVSCFTSRLPNGTKVADEFLRLTFEPGNLLVAYQGLCTLDIETLRPNVRCLLSTTNVRQCYKDFYIEVDRVINKEKKQKLARHVLEELACNASISRYNCETTIYGACNKTAGEIMKDFFYASVPRKCQNLFGVTSRYTAIFNSSVENLANQFTLILVLTISFLKIFYS